MLRRTGGLPWLGIERVIERAVAMTGDAAVREELQDA
jgi:hypothetical protein